MRFIVREREREYEFLLTPGLYVVGRDPTCDLTLESRRVSRRHLSCHVTEDEVEVKDLGSRNGILVGGIRVRSAKLKDGDEVLAGDVSLVLKAGATAPGALVPVAAPEGTVEDREATPPAGALVPHEAAGAGPQLVERDGRWYVTDPGTGREVEIVPAGQAPATARRSLLASPRGRFVIIAAAAAIGLLLAIGLVASVLRGRSPDATISTREYAALLKRAVEALDRDDGQKAKALADAAMRGMPSKKSAEIVAELAAVWDEWRGDFFGHWLKVDRLLKDLLRREESEVIREFAGNRRTWIHEVLAEKEAADEAHELVEAGDYEAAWEKLAGIAEGSPVRESKAELFADARRRVIRHLEEQVRVGAAQQDWAGAANAARKLGDYFPEKAEAAEARLAEYTEYRTHAGLMESARTALDSERFARAHEKLGRIPETSPYYAEAMRLGKRVRAREQYVTALSYYNAGEGEKALKALAALDNPEATSLKKRIESVLSADRAADEAQKAWKLVEAERHWLTLTKLETDAGNAYRKKAARRRDGMEALRIEHAGKLVGRAAEMLKREEFENARRLYEEAIRTDPDGEMGEDGLQSMVDQGRRAYQHGVNYRKTDPEKALSLLERACGLLPADDKYYPRARDEREKLERELQGK
ncbi:MAG: FHA domain-containing protein [Candidatus Brocadiia bacterium]|nr:FHA domain-containing protein [Candidatus Brocadiia bacterium]